MRTYLEILRIPGALKFSAAGLLARAGGAMMGLGIVLMVSALYGSYGLAGALAAANAVAWAGGTAVLSSLVDKYGQRRVMYPATVISVSMLAVVVVLAVMQVPAWALFAPVVISGGTGGAPGALVRARWSNVTSDPHLLHAAFSLESTLDEITFVVGPVVATALSVGVHPAAGLVAPIVLALLGAQLFYSQRATEPPVPPRPADGSAPARRRFILLTPGVGSVVAVNLLDRVRVRPSAPKTRKRSKPRANHRSWVTAMTVPSNASRPSSSASADCTSRLSVGSSSSSSVAPSSSSSRIWNRACCPPLSDSNFCSEACASS